MPDTAILSIWDALSLLIRDGASPPVDESGAPLFAGKRVYRGQTPKGATTLPRSYVMLGQPGEDESGFYGEPGQNGAYAVSCWSDSPENAIRLYRWFKQLVHGQRPTLEGHVLWQGLAVRYLGLQPDPREDFWQARAEVTAESVELAA